MDCRVGDIRDRCGGQTARSSIDPPTSNSYWVSPGRFAAGEYPADRHRAAAVKKLRALLDIGIDHFIDLTDPQEGLEPYDEILGAEARARNENLCHERFIIQDANVPDTPQAMVRILDAIDDALDQGKTVYLHCWGGVGRTGTVVGCWLVRHGMTGQPALDQIADWWKDVEKHWRVPESPETSVQCHFVQDWSEPKAR